MLEGRITDILLSGECLHDDNLTRAVKLAANKIGDLLDRRSDAAVFDLAVKAARDLIDLEGKVDYSGLQGIAATHAFKILSADPVLIETPGDKTTTEFFLAAELETPVYYPELSDKPVDKFEFLMLASSHLGRATTLFGACDWTHPATLIDEHGEGYFGGFEVDNIIYGKHDDGMFLVLYDSADIPLHKETQQDISDLPRLLGGALAKRVLEDAGTHPADMPENYRQIKLEPDEFYFNDERAEKPVVPTMEPK